MTTILTFVLIAVGLVALAMISIGLIKLFDPSK
jgi:hypothetical protein